MDWSTLPFFLAACAGAAATGALFKPGSWYRRLHKPAWTPPNAVFPIAWTLLYIAIAVAAARVAGSGDEAAPLALALWAWQIAFNALWTPVFFGLRRIRAALIVITGLWVAVVCATIAFWRIDPLAGALLAPYLIWISYATALNRAIHRRNPNESPLQPSEL